MRSPSRLFGSMEDGDDTENANAGVVAQIVGAKNSVGALEFTPKNGNPV